MWMLVQCISICLISTFCFFLLLVIDYGWSTSLLAAATFALLLTTVYFVTYHKGYKLPENEIAGAISIGIGYWLFFYAISFGYRRSASTLHLILFLSIVFFVAPFIVSGLLRFRTISGRRGLTGWGYNGPNTVNTFSSSNGSGTHTNTGTSAAINTAINTNSYYDGDMDMQDDFVERHYRSTKDRDFVDPNAFNKLEDPMFPSQAYEWFWVNPLILILGIVPGFILAIVGGLVFGLHGILPGFGIGLMIMGIAQYWVVWKH